MRSPISSRAATALSVVTLSVVTLSLAVVGSAAGQTYSTQDPVLRQIWEQAMNRSQIEATSQVFLDSLGPRLTASPEMERSQQWVIEKYASWGIDALREEYGTWLGWARGVSHIDLIEPRIRSLEGRILAWSPGTEGRPVEAGVVALPPMHSVMDFEAFLPRVAGKFVMISYPQPTCRATEQWREFATPASLEAMTEARRAGQADWNTRLQATGLDRRELPKRLEQAGALGVVSSTWAGSYGTNRIFNAYTREVPTFELGCEDYGLVYRLSANDQGPKLRLSAEAEFRGEVPVYNVIATIPGSELPDEYVMLSAHFDSWEGGSGATDNGSGTMMMMEAARILKEVYPNPKRTILVGHWSGEEQGLNGSRAFAEDHPKVVAGLQVLFNQDNGTGRITRMSASGLTEAGGSLARWLSQVPSEVARGVTLQLPGSPASGGSDHASFICAPAPAFSLGALGWDYGSHTWHTQRDTFDKLVFDDLRNNVVLAASLAYLASEDPERVSRETRSEFPVGRNGQVQSWPTCAPAVRRSSDSPRM